jgi:arabinan endo-1,5-alpha-L-arabinosidase
MTSVAASTTAAAPATSSPQAPAGPSTTGDSASSDAPCRSCESETANVETSEGAITTTTTETTPESSSSGSAPPAVTGSSFPDYASTAPDSCGGEAFDGVRPPPLTLSGNTFAHDPTMIKAGETYYRFWTGDFVPSAKSTDLQQWVNAPSVYGDAYPAWVGEWRGEHPNNTFNFPWAPDVSYFGGKYHLYSSFSAFFGRNSSCITHLSTSDVASGQWTDHGPVICSESDDDFNAIDADVGLDADGKPWLAFGSFWDGIFAFPLDTEGNRVGTELTRLAWAREIEAPVLFYRCGYYYLFVSHGLCCPGEGRSVDDLSYRVLVGRADNILGPYVDRDGKPLLEGGGTVVVEGDGTYAAAGHSDVFVDGERVYHLYHAYRQRDAGAELRIVELPFDAAGWPVGGAP